MRKILRVAFSRYAISALFILAEFVLMTLLLLYYYTYSWIFAIVAGAVNLIAFVSLIIKDTNPEFKLSWLCAVFLLPFVGGILYIAFYNRRLRKKEAAFADESIKRMKESKMRRGETDMTLKNLDELSNISASASGKALSLLSDDPAASLFKGSKLSYFGSGEALFSKMLSDLATAKSFIFLEYFIVEDGVLWQSILEILIKKVNDGVEVRLLYDDIGSMSTLPKRFARDMQRLGIAAYPYGKITPRFTYSHNNRDHRKICIIDGRVAFTGGVNIADEYINKKRRFGYWKDGGVRIEGDAVSGFTGMFLSLFDLTVGRYTDLDKYVQPINGCADEGGYLIPFGSGPAPAYGAPVGKNVLMNIINMAERYLYMTTPYLIIDYDLTEAIRHAARRGVDVRIITPAIADKKIIKIMTKSSYPYLIEAGARIFEYSPGFIHEKMVVCDDLYALVGTINLDYRSLVHHFEDGVFIFRDKVISEVRDSFMISSCDSVEILAEDARLNLVEKTVRNAIKIFAPLL